MVHWALIGWQGVRRKTTGKEHKGGWPWCEGATEKIGNDTSATKYWVMS